MGQLEVVVCVAEHFFFTLCVMMGVVVGGVEAGASVRDNVVNDVATPLCCRLMSIPRGHPNAPPESEEVGVGEVAQKAMCQLKAG